MTRGRKIILGITIIVALIATGLYVFNASNYKNYGMTDCCGYRDETVDSGSNPAGTVETGQTAAQQCSSQGGTWSQQYKECTGISGGSCQEIGGKWNECASACRHNPDAQVCVMMCVQVCTF